MGCSLSCRRCCVLHVRSSLFVVFSCTRKRLASGRAASGCFTLRRLCGPSTVSHFDDLVLSYGCMF
ncbi:hypothetical protein LIA77_00586 [Sarocladium implicatum]|nr:hypothetical protein LIA77_00586 [Sarocladium implicatum]